MTGAATVLPFAPLLQFQILFTPKHFQANGRRAEGMPMILDPAGALHEGVSRYFLQKMGREGATPGTMQVHGYALKDWLQFLHDVGTDWQKPSDNLLSDWTSRQAAMGTGAQRINSKLAIVFGFYGTLQSTGMIWDVLGNPLVPECDADGIPLRFPITAEACVSERRSGNRRVVLRPRVQYRDVTTSKRGRRYTPDTAEVEAVLGHLLDNSATDEFARVRNFLCARVMASMGLRREGTANLTTTALEAALLEAGIPVPDLRPACSEERAVLVADGWVPWLRGLDAIAGMPRERDRIIAGLAGLEGQHRRNVFVTVVEKGRKQRSVPLPLRLSRSLLVEWVWGHRARFIAERRKYYPGYIPPPSLWLSRKTGAGMTKGAIANEVKTAFNALGIDASGHRLRAYFLTELVRDLYLVARAAHGRMFDARTILNQAAEIAGHVHPRSLEPYLSRVMKEDVLRPGEPVLVEHPADAATLRAMADALATANDRVRVPLRTMLGLLLDKFSLQPVVLDQMRPIKPDA